VASGVLPVIDSIASIFHGPLAFARDLLSLSPDGEAIPCSALCEPGVLRDIFDRYATLHEHADRRAVVSMWTQTYAVRLVYPVLASNLMLGRDLPLDPDDTLLLLGPQGNPRGFSLSHDGDPVTARGLERFAPLVRGHLAPLVEAVAKEGRVAQRLVWSNFAVRFDSVAQIGDRQGQLCDTAREDIATLLRAERWPDGWANPLREPYRDDVWDGQPVRRRKVCCLRYMLPDFEGCGGSCPVPGGRGECGTRH
jgi:ferric iron reductase protein FhuF